MSLNPGETRAPLRPTYSETESEAPRLRILILAAPLRNSAIAVLSRGLDPIDAEVIGEMGLKEDETLEIVSLPGSLTLRSAQPIQGVMTQSLPMLLTYSGQTTQMHCSVTPVAIILNPALGTRPMGFVR